MSDILYKEDISVDEYMWVKYPGELHFVVRRKYCSRIYVVI